IILSASLITQIEFKNNTWKQWHTTPQNYSILFIAKLTVIIVMMIQFFVLFNLGIYLSAVVPGLVIKGVPYPIEPIPFSLFIKQNLHFFIFCLPIIGLQYLISLQFRNFMVPVGGGILIWIASVGSLTWKYAYIIPYTHGSLFFLKIEGRNKQDTNLIGWALCYFCLFTLLSYFFYVTKKEKG
ncbi:MAG: ABC transporter permease, partial [Chitinophagaceae bacterium]